MNTINPLEIKSAEKRLSVLIIDDSRTNRMVLSAMLKKLDCEVLSAEDGQSGLDIFYAQQPDIVLVDIMMPGMDGYEVTKTIRAKETSWTPIIIVSAMQSSEDVVTGLACGADDYMMKPLNPSILASKIKMLGSRLTMSRKIQEQNNYLLGVQHEIDEENVIAKSFINRLAAIDRIDDPAVKFFMKAAENFSGDLIAVSRTPSGRLHVMLADSTGHGLTAALAVMPVMQPFVTMTNKGFDISAILSEINRRVGEYLPRGRFVAMTMLSIDCQARVIEAWNGGCPPLILLKNDGTIAWQVKSSNFALGVLPANEFDATVSRRALKKTDADLVIFSDGVIDTLSQESMSHGMSTLIDITSGADRECRFDAIRNRLSEITPLDDMALMFIDCQQEAAIKGELVAHAKEREQVVSSERGEFSTGWEASFRLISEQLKTVDTVPLLLSIIKQFESGSQDASGKVFLVLSELFNNALDHGVLRLSSSLKNAPSGMDAYFDERTARIERLTDGQITIHMASLESSGKLFVQITIEDSGDGFDFTEFLADDSHLRELNQTHGRGIAMITQLGCKLEYSNQGRTAKAIIPL